MPHAVRPLLSCSSSWWPFTCAPDLSAALIYLAAIFWALSWAHCVGRTHLLAAHIAAATGLAWPVSRRILATMVEPLLAAAARRPPLFVGAAISGLVLYLTLAREAPGLFGRRPKGRLLRHFHPYSSWPVKRDSGSTSPKPVFHFDPH